MPAQSFRGAGGVGAVVTPYRHESRLTNRDELAPLESQNEVDMAATEALLARAASGLVLVIVLLIGAWIMTS
jgi:hypothetical protein